MAGFSQQRQTGGTFSTGNSSRNPQPTRMGNGEEEEVYDFLGDTKHLDVLKMEKARLDYEKIKRELAMLDEKWEHYKEKESSLQSKMNEATLQVKLIETCRKEKLKFLAEIQPVMETIVISDSDDDDVDDDDNDTIEVIDPRFPAETHNGESAPKRKRSDENDQAKEKDVEDDSQVSFEFLVRWRWKDETTHILRKYQTFHDIFQHYADIQKTSIRNVTMETEDGRLIYPAHTPESIGLKHFELINGVNLDDGFLPSMKKFYGDRDGRLPIKIRHRNAKQNMIIRVKPEAPLIRLMLQAAETLKKDYKKFKFYFNGQRVNPQQTASELRLVGKEIFDLIINE
ncbi:hypothetical protein B566_EDAN009358 [Ephemera danica]|nr:hypothetical protein B566_EDAN009358 [Ephemera danica]